MPVAPRSTASKSYLPPLTPVPVMPSMRTPSRGIILPPVSIMSSSCMELCISSASPKISVTASKSTNSIRESQSLRTPQSEVPGINGSPCRFFKTCTSRKLSAVSPAPSPIKSGDFKTKSPVIKIFPTTLDLFTVVTSRRGRKLAGKSEIICQILQINRVL